MKLHQLRYRLWLLSGLRRWYLRRLPTTMRTRAALAIGKRLVFATVRQSTVTTQFDGTSAGIDINSALFDQLRDPATIPMRAFYASAIDRVLALCAVDAEVVVTNNLPGAWRLAITVRGSRPLEVTDAA